MVIEVKLKKIIVVGGGGNAKVITGILQKLNSFDIIGYTDLNDKGRLLGIPYLGNDEIIDDLITPDEKLSVVIGVGQTNITSLRSKIYSKLKNKNINLPTIISPDALINREVDFGEATIIYDRCFINFGAEIKKGVIVNSGCILEHDCKLGNFVNISPGCVIGGGVNIGENSFIGLGARIIQSITICSDCTIGAGAVVLRDCNEPGLYAGIPAERIK